MGLAEARDAVIAAAVDVAQSSRYAGPHLDRANHRLDDALAAYVAAVHLEIAEHAEEVSL